MGIIAWIVLGLLAGIIAKFLMPGADPGGIIVTILLGIAGAFVGGFIAGQLGYGGINGFTWHSLLLAVLGAVLLLVGYRFLRRRGV